MPTLLDLRAQQVNPFPPKKNSKGEVVNTSKTAKGKTVVRDPKTVTGIGIHQTACLCHHLIEISAERTGRAGEPGTEIHQHQRRAFARRQAAPLELHRGASGRADAREARWLGRLEVGLFTGTGNDVRHAATAIEEWQRATAGRQLRAQRSGG